MKMIKNNSKVLPLFVALLPLLGTLTLPTCSFAQNRDDKTGKLILPESLNSSNAKGAPLSEAQLDAFWQKVDSRRLERVRSTWRFESQSNARPSLDVEKEMAKVKAANEKIAAASKSDGEKILAVNQKYIQDRKAGFTAGSQMNFVRVGPILKAEVIDDGTYLISGKIRTYDFFDAQNKLAVTLDETTNGNSQADKNGFATNFKLVGIVTRNAREEVLPHSSPNEAAVLLAAANVKDYFSRDDTSVSTEGDLIYLDKAVKEPRSGMDMTMRLVLQKTSLQPMRLLASWLSKKRSGWMSVYEVEASQLVNGVSIPSKVAIYTANSNDPGGGVDTYVLKKIRANEAVDPRKSDCLPMQRLPIIVLVKRIRMLSRTN